MVEELNLSNVAGVLAIACLLCFLSAEYFKEKMLAANKPFPYEFYFFLTNVCISSYIGAFFGVLLCIVYGLIGWVLWLV